MLDTRTIIILYFIINIISAGSMAIMWKQHRQRYSGILLWTINMILQACGLFMLMLGEVFGHVITVLFSNTIIVGGIILLYLGLQKFVGQKTSQLHNYLALLVFFLCFVYYGLINPHLIIREIIISVMIVFLNSQIAWFLLRRVPRDLRPITGITGIILGCYAFVSLIRIVLIIAIPQNSNNFFNPSITSSIVLTLYAALSACLTISMALMVNARLLREVQTQERKFYNAFNSSPYAIVLSRAEDGVIFEINEGFLNLTGYRYDEIIGKSALDLRIWLRPEDREYIVSELTRQKMVKGLEMQFRKKSGEIAIGLYSAAIITINGEHCIISSISDITELSQMKQRLQIMATHDALTGLPNRLFFNDRFDLAFTQAQRDNLKFAVLSLDIDHFKEINDRLGHDIGDMILILAAQRMKSSLRKADTAARFGGDEFVIMVQGINQPEDAIKVAAKIVEEFRQPFIIDTHQLKLSVSIGISIYPEDGSDINTLIKKSDEALYYVKSNGRGNYRLFSDGV